MVKVKLPTLRRCRAVNSADRETLRLKLELAEAKAQLADAQDVIDGLRRRIAEHFKRGGVTT